MVTANINSASLSQLQRGMPSPASRLILIALASLVLAALLWAAFGKLDVVAVAQGKLVPASHVKIVQPAEQGIVREILIREGDHVLAGQVLFRMDAIVATADRTATQAEYDRARLTVRRVESELAGLPLRKLVNDPDTLYVNVEAQYQANVLAFERKKAELRATLARAGQEVLAAEEIKSKLEKLLPNYQEQEQAYQQLHAQGFAGTLELAEKRGKRLEAEADLQTQVYKIGAARAQMEEATKTLAQIGSEYERALQTERVQASADMARIGQALAKVTHQVSLLELKAPQDGTVKDLATYTRGTVVSPGTVLVTLVPQDEVLRAEVWVENDDIGFVRAGPEARVKVSAFQFQKYGLVHGSVVNVGPDSSEQPAGSGSSGAAGQPPSASLYRALVELSSPVLDAAGVKHKLGSGMQVSAEIRLGERTVLEYILSPVTKAFSEAARER